MPAGLGALGICELSPCSLPVLAVQPRYLGIHRRLERQLVGMEGVGTSG